MKREREGNWSEWLFKFGLFLRVIGVVVMLGGLWGLYQVGGAYWEIYKDPGQVKTFAHKIEQATGLNRSLHSWLRAIGDVAERNMDSIGKELDL